MTEKFKPVPVKVLVHIILNELKKEKSVFGIPQELFFIPGKTNLFKTKLFNQIIDSPLGVAAGPHSQMAQNIVAAWLMGARYIELKTIQTLDELDVAKPCIDMQDEGYNCEWSQELKIKESYNEYLNAWIIIHILNQELGFKKDIGTIFNMSVGYNLEGIMKENVQWFFSKMEDSSAELKKKISEIKSVYSEIASIKIPAKISDNITLSTMHGCPAGEIEKIATYLIEKKKLHTFVKLNPTLLGPKVLRDILNNKLNFKTDVPDNAFQHDLKYPDALKIIVSLQKISKKHKLEFGLKLTNTLESLNNKTVFPKAVKMMYMSGRALHPVSVNLAAKLRKDLNAEISMSFSAGADAFSFADVLACGFKTITVCSDILKPGGYMRLNQYFDEAGKIFSEKKVKTIEEYICKKGGLKKPETAAEKNLERYAKEVLASESYKRDYIISPDIKTNRYLGFFDCIQAPCVETCATNQDVPGYMFHASKSNFSKGQEVILRTNPFPSATGMVCDHLCQNKCTRVHYDKSLHIREVKRYISEQEQVKLKPLKSNGKKVAVVGAGPSGLSCAYFLALSGFKVEVFESRSKAGGMVQFAIPGFRITDSAIDRDFKRIKDLGVKINFSSKIDKKAFAALQKGYDYIYIGSGAPVTAKPDFEGSEAKGVIQALDFLLKAKKGENTGLGKNVVIIGGGNTAMDAARTAYRLVGKTGKVTVVYRRTVNEMPADKGEIKAVIDEGIEIIELTAPEKVILKKVGISGLSCCKMNLSGIDESGRPKPVKVKNSASTISCDTIITALGQRSDIDFISTDVFEADKNTYKTNLKNVFIGGDALNGASTAIKAIGDGRKTAEIIIEEAGVKHFDFGNSEEKHLSKKDLMLKRAFRIPASEIKELPLSERKSFKLVSSTLDKKSVINEAGRCLFCDEICNICTTVCPNFANRSYSFKPVKYMMQKALVRSSENIVFAEDGVFEVTQQYQIMHITNFCNECGNCNTFCPTNSAPYKEKPKLHITKDSYESAEEGYYFEGDTLYCKQFDVVRKLKEHGDFYIFDYEYANVKFNKSDFRIAEIKIKEDAPSELWFHSAAAMSVIMKGAKELQLK